jgi:hypothetical protein
MSDKKKICPIRAAAWRVVHGDADVPTNRYAHCIEQRCAWWKSISGVDGECVVVYIGSAVQRILKILDIRIK